MIDKRIFKPKYYIHIDSKLNINDVIDKIKDKTYISKHSFYPFLSYQIIFKKYSKEIDSTTGKHFKQKIRPIKYASHIDRSIYQWYSHILNEKFNEYANRHNLDECCIAYRTCLKGQTNIEFSAKAIKFLKSHGDSYIIVSDFSNFFDRIDHNILKENLCKILGVDFLPEDFYKVYRSMTHYCSIDKSLIEQYLIERNIETEDTIKKLNCLFQNITWKEAKKDLKSLIDDGINKNKFGIPQGSPLSGVFANIFMIDFDEKASQYAKTNNGLYMRYSDDIIIIIPKKEVKNIKEIWTELCIIKDNYPTLIMNIEKTNGYEYSNKKIQSLHNEIFGMKKSPNYFSYLGFSFDGKNVKFRDKTLTKFFYKLYRGIDSMLYNEGVRTRKGKKRNSKIEKSKIIKRLNSTGKNKNFFDYVSKTKKVFPREIYIVKFKKNIKGKIFRRFNDD